MCYSFPEYNSHFSSIRPVMPFKTESCVRVSVRASVSPPGLLPYSTCDICHFDMWWCPLELCHFYLLEDLHILLTPFCHPVTPKQTATVRLHPYCIHSSPGFLGTYRLRGYGNPKLQGPVAFSRLVCEIGHVTFAQASVLLYQGQRKWETNARKREDFLSFNHPCTVLNSGSYPWSLFICINLKRMHNN